MDSGTIKLCYLLMNSIFSRQCAGVLITVCLPKAGPEPWAMLSLWMYVNSWGENRWVYCIPQPLWPAGTVHKADDQSWQQCLKGECCISKVSEAACAVPSEQSSSLWSTSDRALQRRLRHSLVIVHACARRGCVNLMFPFLPAWFSKAFKPFMLHWVKIELLVFSPGVGWKPNSCHKEHRCFFKIRSWSWSSEHVLITYQPSDLISYLKPLMNFIRNVLKTPWSYHSCLRVFSPGMPPHSQD